MKRKVVAGMLLVVMAIICFLFLGQAAELITNRPQRAVQPPIQPQPSKQQTLLPDLIVERVWLDSRNHIVLTLKNTGKGPVSDDSHAKGYVKVTYGVGQRDFALTMVDPGKAVSRSGGAVSFTTDIELNSPTRVTVEVDSARQISESREDNNLLSTSLTPRVAISQEPKPAKPPVGGITITSQAEIKPSGVVSKVEPLIRTTKIYQKGAKIHIVLKNEGQGKISSRDYHQGKVVLRYGGKSKSFLLKDVDPGHRLDNPGAELDFDTNIPLETKPGGGGLPVNVTFYDLKDMKTAPMEMAVPLFPQPQVAKPDFAWTTIRTAGSVTPALINKGGRFVGGLDYKISAQESSNLYEHRQLVFQERNPFDHGEVVPVPLYYIPNHIDWRRVCSLHLFCEVKSQHIPEADETNNSAVITVYPPPSHARFELMNEAIDLRSGTELWVKHDRETIEINEKVTVARPDVVSMDVDFTVFNCSGETRTLNPHITYLGAGGQKKEQNLGAVQIGPGEHKPFHTRIQLAIRFGNYERDNFIILNLSYNKSLRVNVDFTSDLNFRARLYGRLHISQGPYIQLNNQKKEVTIKCYVYNHGPPVQNQKWWLSLHIEKQNLTTHSKNWDFNRAGEKELIDRSFTFKPTYDGEHTYKLKLSAHNKTILTDHLDGLQRIGSFDVPSSW